MIVFGRNVAKEVIKNNIKINKVYIQEGIKEEVINELQSMDINIKYLNKNDMNKIEKGNHQGIILDIEDYKYYDEKKMLDNINETSFIVILDHLEDPHNFGAIVRTSYALGINAIIIPNDRSVDITPTVVKTSAGAIYNIPIIKVPNLTNTIEKLKKEGYWIVGTDMKGENYSELKYDMPTCLVIGNEGKGMSQIIKKNCDYLVSIPMEGQIDSLNASVSCGIILSEIKRQRRSSE